MVRPGSSPLTRGKPGGGRHLNLDPGLIPAHAGKTPAPCPGGTGGGAHPRSRGENSMLKDRLRYEDGSSPLTRGKPRCHPDPGRHRRLIPAHAGKTVIVDILRISPRAHPRSRGENIQSPSQTVKTSGSSPLTRGKRRAQQLISYGQRLIPAHAGKTSSFVFPTRLRWAHPRSRGENNDLVRHAGRVQGSSPLTRGKR